MNKLRSISEKALRHITGLCKSPAVVLKSMFSKCMEVLLLWFPASVCLQYSCTPWKLSVIRVKCLLEIAGKLDEKMQQELKSLCLYSIYKWPVVEILFSIRVEFFLTVLLSRASKVKEQQKHYKGQCFISCSANLC